MSLSPRRFTGKNVARVLETLLGDANYNLRAKEVSRKFIGHDGLAMTAQSIEKFVAARKPATRAPEPLTAV